MKIFSTLTIRQQLEKKLYEHGLFKEQTRDCIAAWEATSQVAAVLKGYRSNYFDAKDDAVPNGLLWMSVRKFTLDWLKANHPEHWAIGVFEIAVNESR